MPVAIALALKFTVPPIHTGLVFVGAAVGIGFIETVVVAVTEQPVPGAVAITVYIPAIASVTGPLLGVALVDEKLEGPTQEYEVAPVAFALKLTVPPTQTGLVLVGVVVGRELTVTAIMAALDPHELVTV